MESLELKILFVYSSIKLLISLNLFQFLTFAERLRAVTLVYLLNARNYDFER